MEIINSKTFKIIASILGLVITYSLTELYLISNFSFSGEAYRKGLGHILSENFAKGSFFIFCRELFGSFFFSSIIYFLIENNIQVFFKKIVVPIWFLILLLITIFVGTKVYDIFSWNYDRENRIIEISLTWYTRALGFLISYLVIKNYVLSKKKHNT